ncbi:MAG: ABC transporter permease [Alphaproteobacteria bacterium]|nr:ABC transporter permease [Alphaproteobacteria bacterium]
MTLALVVRRFGMLLLVVWAASTLIFFVPRLAPGNPVRDKLLAATEQGAAATDMKALVAAYNAKFGLDRPLWEQYLNFLGDTARFDLGFSIAYYPSRTTDMIATALPWTIGLLTTTTLLGFLLGTILGALTVWQGAPRLFRYLVPLLMIFSAVPFYLIGLVLIYVFSFELGWFPLGGGTGIRSVTTLSWALVVEIFHHSILPAASIVLATVGIWALSMRGMMVTVQGEDYMTFAEAIGLADRRRFLQYGLRNAILPQVTLLALSLGHVISGSILVELVFGYPGVGQQLYRAIQHLDYFVIYGIVFILICTIAIAMLIMDLVYPLLDPRIRRVAVGH